jgi:hypothetical protein
MTGLILKRAPIGWHQDDYDVIENGVVVGRIFKVPIAPPGPSLDVGERRPHTPRDARLQAKTELCSPIKGLNSPTTPHDPIDPQRFFAGA